MVLEDCSPRYADWSGEDAKVEGKVGKDRAKRGTYGGVTHSDVGRSR